jgi:hypothetical protein
MQKAGIEKSAMGLAWGHGKMPTQHRNTFAANAKWASKLSPSFLLFGKNYHLRHQYSLYFLLLPLTTSAGYFKRFSAIFSNATWHVANNKVNQLPNIIC